MAKADTTNTAPRTPKSADERLKSALAGFAPVEEATVSEAQEQRKTAERVIRNSFAGVVSTITPEHFEEAQKETVAKAFSSLKRAQTALLKAVKGTSDEGAASLPGVVVASDEAEGFDVAE